MDKLVIQGSRKTPQISLLPSGELTFSGVSMPEDAATFYFKIMDWISDYYRHPEKETKINISFKYLNSSSSSMIFKIFHCLNRLQLSGKTSVYCAWEYDHADDGMKEFIDKIINYADQINFEVKAVEHLTEIRA